MVLSLETQHHLIQDHKSALQHRMAIGQQFLKREKVMLEEQLRAHPDGDFKYRIRALNKFALELKFNRALYNADLEKVLYYHEQIKEYEDKYMDKQLFSDVKYKVLELISTTCAKIYAGEEEVARLMGENIKEQYNTREDNIATLKWLRKHCAMAL